MKEKKYLCVDEITKGIPKHLKNGKFERNWILCREVT